MSIGTDWRAPGQGVRPVDLVAALAHHREEGVEKELVYDAMDNLRRLTDTHGPEHRTNLTLTGLTIRAYDVRRMAACE